jgi:glycosyltransferase involved in cell wall biosynthesis
MRKQIMKKLDDPIGPEVSVVVPISDRHDDMRLLYNLYANELKELDKTFEFVFVVDGQFPIAYGDLKKLKDEGNPIKIIKYARTFGEANALMAGFKQTKGSIILTLASYLQVEPADLAKVFAAYNEGNDMVITCRYPRKDPVINRIQSKAYHCIVGKLTNTMFKDITSGMRVINKKILSEFNLYGDLHRFIPIFAVKQGLKVTEVTVAQRKEDTQARLVKPGIYLRRILDILTLFFIIKFTKKPLRFFGLIGSCLCIPGFLITGYLGMLRVIGKIELANRPILLLGILLFVFGLQLFSVGLIGELILFTRAQQIQQYRVEEVIE